MTERAPTTGVLIVRGLCRYPFRKNWSLCGRLSGAIIIGLLAIVLTACDIFTTVTPVPPPATPPPATAAAPAATSPPLSAPPLSQGAMTVTPTGTFDGYHERNTCTVIGGWAYDSSRPDIALSVDIFDGSTLLATLVAGTFRADLRDAGKGNGNHSFTFTPPAQVKDGKAHQISIRITGTNIGLNGTPMPLTCAQ
jgi:hypothetical protein